MTILNLTRMTILQSDENEDRAICGQMRVDFGLVATAAMTGSTYKYIQISRVKKHVPDEYYSEKCGV